MPYLVIKSVPRNDAKALGKKNLYLLHWDSQSLMCSHLLADMKRKPQNMAVLSSIRDMKMISQEITYEKSVTFVQVGQNFAI